MLSRAACRVGVPMVFLSLIVLLSLFVELGGAASPTSFCKCTCFSAYRIIPLDAAPDPDDPTSINQLAPRILLSRADTTTTTTLSSSSSSSSSTPSTPSTPSPSSTPESSPDDRKEYRAKTCNDCNRSFCLAQNLPECRDAADGDVFATCFQRDSSKDEAVVWVFLLTTVGLLAWAVLKPVVERVRGGRGDGGWGYLPVAVGGSGGGGRR